MTIKKTFQHCSQCDIEMNPGLYDDVDRYFIINDEIYCPDCFHDWLAEEVRINLDAVAEAMDIDKVYVPYNGGRGV